MRRDRTTEILASLALLHDDLDAIRSELAGIRSDLDKIAADTGYQAGVIRAAEGSVRALVDGLRELVGLPPARTVAAKAPRVSLADLAAYGSHAAPALVRPRPPEPSIRPPIEERIRQLRRAGFGGYDAARILMREHYPMREIVRHLHVSPRKLTGLGEGEAEA
ncbi:MAG: hypothetical protein RXS42_08480 [Nitrososphaeria archaeon]